MPDDYEEIRLKIEELERYIIKQDIETSFDKTEDSLNKTSNNLDKLSAELNDVLAKEKIRLAYNRGCVDPNITCIVIGPNEVLNSASKNAQELTNQLTNGDITLEQYIAKMEAIFDELPFDERQRFTSLLAEQEWLDDLSGFRENVTDYIPKPYLEDFLPYGINHTVEGTELFLTYFQSYAVGGHEAAIRSVISVLSENALKEFFVAGVAYPLLVSAGLTPIPAFLFSVFLASKGLDYLKTRDQEYIDTTQINE